MDDRILEQLYQPFELKERKGVGNKIFKYVPSEDIVDRMNRAFQGNWSTEVQKVEVIEDQVLMCVRVSIQDPTNANAKMLWQDGYASHPLTRYTSGPNNGKIIDVGNSYKSAMSKAIKTAVTKWGVALYLEQSDDVVTTNAPFAAPMTSFDAPATSVPTATNTMPTGPFGAPVVQPQRNVAAEPKKVVPVVPGPPMDGPPMTASPTQNTYQADSKSSLFQPPVFTVENTDVSDSGGFELPKTSGNTEKLTSVQKVAIETILSMNNTTFEDLLGKALQRANNLPASLEDVSYLDAVTIIQYGNNLRQI